MVVTVSAALREAIVAKKIPREKINVIPNGANMKRFAPGAALPQQLERLNLRGKFVVGYVGTHGLAQGLESLVDAAEILRDREDIHFLMVGEGARRTAMMDLATSRNLQNITFVGAVPAAQVSQYLAACDAIVVPLRKSSISPGAIPSKIFDAAAMSRPIILAVDGISAELIKEYEAGVVTEPENAEALAQTILELKASPETCKRLGGGAQMIARDYDRERLADLMLEHIAKIAGNTIS